MPPRRDSLAYKSSEFSEEERVEMIIDDLLAHTITRNDAVERIYEVLRAGDATDKSVGKPKTKFAEGGIVEKTDILVGDSDNVVPTVAAFRKQFFHGADCRKEGGKWRVNVYHFSDCAGGESCELYKYLDQEGVAEKHVKHGWEYTVTMDKNGGFNFEGKKL